MSTTEEELLRGIREAHTILVSRRHTTGVSDEVEKILAELLRKHEPVRQRVSTGSGTV
jgi:hypothetical protein